MSKEQKDSQFEGQTIVVAGGAGEVGEGIVAALLARGAVVVVPSRSQAKLDALETAVRPAAGRLVAVQTEVETDAGRRALVSALLRTPPLRAVVLSLGSFWQGPRVLDVPASEFASALSPRLFVQLELLQAMRPLLRGRNTSIVQINGLAATVALPGLSVVHVSAAAELALTRSLIADSDADDPRVVSLLIDAWVRTRSRPDLGAEAMDLRAVGDAVADRIAGAAEHAILRLGLAEGRLRLTPLDAGAAPEAATQILDAVPAFDRAGSSP